MVSQTFVTLPEAILNLYNWPSEKDETWRHMTNFAFFNSKEELTSLELYEGSKGCTLKGCLLPPPSKGNTPSAIVKRWVSIRISHFSIDFGDDDEDPSRGFWLADFEGAWYKVEEPTAEYHDVAILSKIKCAKFLEFFDVVVHQEVAEEEYFSLYDDEAETYSCELTLLELHQSCSPKFDMAFLESNACFYYEQLDNQFSVDCPLMRDLKIKADSLRLSLQTSRLKKQAASLQAMRDAAAPMDQAIVTDSSDSEVDSNLEELKDSSSEAEMVFSDSSDEADALMDSDEDQATKRPRKQSQKEQPREQSREQNTREQKRDDKTGAEAITLPVVAKKRKRREDSAEKDRQGRVRLKGLKSIQRDRMKQLSRKSQSQRQGHTQSHREEYLTDKLSEEVQAAGDRARAQDLAVAKTAHVLPPPQHSKQGTGLKPDYLLVQQRAKDERMAHLKHHLPIPVKALGVDRHNPRSHIH